MIKKSIALLLTLLLAITTLAGCNTKKSAGDPTPTPTATPTAAPADPFPGADLKGVTLKLSGIQNPETADEAKKDMWRTRQKAVEEKFNCKLVFDTIQGIEWNDVPAKINESIAAGDPLVDLYNCSRYYVPELAMAGSLIDMTKEVPAYNFPKLYYKEIAYWGENIIGFLPGPYMGWTAMVYNRDMIKKAGMAKTPGEMFKEGKWSYDDFYNYLAELKTKLPAGVTPFGCHVLTWVSQAGFANGAMIMDPVTYAPAYNTDAMYQCVELFQKMVQNGLTVKATPVTRADGSQGYDWNPAAGGFGDGKIAMAFAASWDFEGIASKFDYGVVGFPWGPNVTISNNDYKTLSDNYSGSCPDAGIMVMIKGAEKKITPEQFMNLFFTYNEETGKQLLIDREKEAKGEQLTAGDAGTPRNFTTDLDVEIWDWMIARNRFEPANSSEQSNVWFRALYKVAYTGENVRSAFEAVIGQDAYAMVDAGLLKPENIPAGIKAAYDAYAKTVTPTPTPTK